MSAFVSTHFRRIHLYSWRPCHSSHLNKVVFFFYCCCLLILFPSELATFLSFCFSFTSILANFLTFKHPPTTLNSGYEIHDPCYNPLGDIVFVRCLFRQWSLLRAKMPVSPLRDWGENRRPAHCHTAHSFRWRVTQPWLISEVFNENLDTGRFP